MVDVRKINQNRLNFFVGEFKKAKVIINPAANHGITGKRADRITSLLKSRIKCELIFTKRPGHAEELARELKGFDLLIGVGGDGTLNEIVNGLMSSRQTIPLAFIPAGSGNDFRRMTGISKRIDIAVDQIENGKVILVDTGKANDRYFANSLGIGLDARVALLVNQTKGKTKKSGFAHYLKSLFQILLKDHYAHKVQLKIDDGEWREKEITLLATNLGKSYGGGFLITPQAKNDDGLLDVCYVDALPAYEIMFRLPFVIPGKHTWMKPFHSTQAERVWVKTVDGGPLPAHLDGEITLSDAYEIEILPKRLPLVVSK